MDSVGVSSDDGFALGDLDPLFLGLEWVEFNFVVESGSFDCFGGGGGFVQPSAQSVPGGLAEVGHGWASVGSGECVGHDWFR